MTATDSIRTRRCAKIAIILLIVLLLLPDIVYLWWFHNDVRAWVNSATVPVILLSVLFAALGDALWLASLLLIPFAVLAPIEALYIATYHHPTSAEILATIFASNPRETREFLDSALLPLLLCLTAALGLGLFAAWSSWHARLRWTHGSRAWVLILAFVTPLMMFVTTIFTTEGDVRAKFDQATQTTASLADPIEFGYPFGMFQRYLDYHREWGLMRSNVARLQSYRFHAMRNPGAHQRQIYVLVIGEASRRDHWQLFGYDRPTNPELSRIAGLVPISNMVSSWPESINAIPMIVTRKPPTMKSMDWPEASILRAMHEAGYDTWWLSNQLPIGRYDSPVSTYAFEADHAEFFNRATWGSAGAYDDDLLQPLRNALAHSDRDEFIVLHLMGSHQGYDYRYPEAFRYFRPTEHAAAGSTDRRLLLRNSYDNSIFFTDHVLATVIGILKSSGAITALWYESDHGESLPTATCKLEGHGNGTRYEYEVSALFWASSAYATAFPEKIAAIRSNAGKRTMSADTFESMMDMANITYPRRNALHSLFDPNWQYRPRAVNFPWGVNFDEAEPSKNCQMMLPKGG